jgi:predicted amidohydrolase YtcJ
MAARLTTFVVVAIVAVTLIAGLIVGAQRDDNDGPVDLIVHNARVYTAQRDGAMAEAVAIRGNQILRVGGEREITRLKRPQTTMIDAKGGAVLPGFNDPDVDLGAGGAALDRLDLLGAESVEDLEQRIRDWAEAFPDRPWILGRGWRRETFGEALPTRQLLDRLVPDRPAQLLSADGTTAWVNTKALRLAKVVRATASPAHGLIVHDSRSGEPTGILQGAAIALIDRLIPASTPAERERAFAAAVEEAHRRGVTSVQDMVATADKLAVYAETKRLGDLHVRIYAAVPVASDLPDGDLDRLQALIARYPDDPIVKAGAVSITLDDGRADAKAPGDRLLFDADTLNRMVRRLDARGWQVITRAASDVSVAMALTAFEHAVRSNPDRTLERRHRIRDLRTVADDDLPRLKALGILAAMTPPAGLAPDASSAEAMAATARRLALAGAPLAFGSGWPSAPLDPIAALAAATGAAAAGNDDVAQMSLKTAIDAYTAAGAWASFDEQRKGTLAPGMLADIVVLSHDIFTTPAAPAPPAAAGPLSQLPGTRVNVTIFDGKVVYRRSEHATN